MESLKRHLFLAKVGRHAVIGRLERDVSRNSTPLRRMGRSQPLLRPGTRPEAARRLLYLSQRHLLVGCRSESAALVQENFFTFFPFLPPASEPVTGRHARDASNQTPSLYPSGPAESCSRNHAADTSCHVRNNTLFPDYRVLPSPFSWGMMSDANGSRKPHCNFRNAPVLATYICGAFQSAFGTSPMP